MSYISCHDLIIGYDGHAIANPINFQVNKSDYVCIVGENGAGKSTLMKTILGLQPALGGSIDFGNGLERNEVGYLPQQTTLQKDFPASVEEIVLTGCLPGKPKFFYSKSDRERVAEKLNKLGIYNLRKRSYRTLSGGQQQKVLLARALCATSKIFFLDEPVTGLDQVSTNDMYETIDKLNDGDISIVMVTHDIDEAVKRANHILYVGNKENFFGTSRKFSESKFYIKISGKEG